MAILTVQAADERVTSNLGAALAGALAAGLTIGLVGPLGAGKTTLVRAIATQLGVDPRLVSSPTFVLVHHYEGRMPVYHFDAYRLKSADEFFDLGIDEYFASAGVSLVEWADRVEATLPEDRLTIRVEIAGPLARTFTIESSGPNSDAALARVAKVHHPG